MENITINIFYINKIKDMDNNNINKNEFFNCNYCKHKKLIDDFGFRFNQVRFLTCKMCRNKLKKFRDDKKIYNNNKDKNKDDVSLTVNFD